MKAMQTILALMLLMGANSAFAKAECKQQAALAAQRAAAQNRANQVLATNGSTNSKGSAAAAN